MDILVLHVLLQNLHLVLIFLCQLFSRHCQDSLPVLQAFHDILFFHGIHGTGDGPFGDP